MTQAFPDVSSYQAGLKIQPGTVAVIAKATEGTYYEDPCFKDFMAQAEHVGAIEAGYHFLKQGNAAAQAEACYAFAGAWPMMIDCEPLTGSMPTITDCIEFTQRFHELGGRVFACYFPRWYWDRVGGNFIELRDRYGVALVSSNYDGYTDAPSGAGWLSYGGVTPSWWQYTRNFPYGGKQIDFNAFRGTLSDLRSLIQGDDMTPMDVWSYKGNNGDGNTPDSPDVHQTVLTTRDNVSALQATVAQHGAELQGISALLARVAEKLGA
ncbi:MAG: hypothetical protein HOY79_49665 [Streptomyces sp.]|nr:hypothetical protein [Streptomyces sp.]